MDRFRSDVNEMFVWIDRQREGGGCGRRVGVGYTQTQSKRLGVGDCGWRGQVSGYETVLWGQGEDRKW